MSRLADDLAHEIKNPLHAMVINLEVLKRRVEKARWTRRWSAPVYMEDEVRAAARLAGGVASAVAARPRSSASPANVGQVLDEMTALLELRARIARVEFSQDASVHQVYAAVKPRFVAASPCS